MAENFRNRNSGRGQRGRAAADSLQQLRQEQTSSDVAHVAPARSTTRDASPSLRDECRCPAGCGGLPCEQGGSLRRSTPDDDDDDSHHETSDDSTVEFAIGDEPANHAAEHRPRAVHHYPGRDHADGTLLVDIPFDELGMLCDLAPSCKHLKGALVPAVRGCFNRILDRLRDGNNIGDASLWKKLILLPRVLLTPVVEEKRWTRQQRCAWVMSDDWSHFTVGAFKSKPKPRGPGTVLSSDAFQKAKIRRVVSLMSDGEISRSCKALQTKQVPLLSSEQVFDRMQELHPPAENGGALRELPRDIAQLQLQEADVLKMIRQAKKSLSPCGISSLRYELLKQFVNTCDSQDQTKFLDNLTWFLTTIVNGRVPEEVMGTMRSTQGAAIPKRDSKIRPLGLRDTLVNLALKTALRSCKDKMSGIFDGLNYALAGSKKMDELIALMGHAIRTCPEHDRVFIDATNAFNLVNRDKALDAMERECPELATVFRALYNGATKVWLRNEDDDWTSILAQMGCVQGCVMGPCVFGFSTLDAYVAVKDSLRDCANGFFGAFLDDGGLSAAHDYARRALATYLVEGAECGLNVNFALGKTEILLGVCNSAEEVERRIQGYGALNVPRENIRIHPQDGGDEETYGYVHLGVPVGSRAFQLRALSRMVDEFETLSRLLRELKNPQQEWVLAYWVLRQKFPYWLRHMCPSVTGVVAPRIDRIMRDTLSPIVGNNLEGEHVWEQMRLPIKSCGFGIGHVEDTISAAFVANQQETKAHVMSKLPSAVGYLQHLDGDGELVGPTDECRAFVDTYREHRERILRAARDTAIDDFDGRLEKALEGKKVQFLYSKVLSGLRVSTFKNKPHARVEKARINSADGSMSGAWLLSIPKCKHSKIEAFAFNLACQLRLGIPFSGQANFCSCTGRPALDRYGRHILACKMFRYLLKNRHDALVDVLKALAQMGGVRADDRGLTVFRVIDNDDGKRPDLLLPGFEDDGRDLLLDVTVGTPTCQSYFEGAANHPHHTLRLLHNRKNAKYLRRCTEIGASFMPMAFETFGAASEEAMGVVAKLVQKASDVTKIPYSILFNYWKKRLSTTMQVQNARILVNATRDILGRRDRQEEEFDAAALLEQIH